MPGQARVLKPTEIERVFVELGSLRNRLLFGIGLYTGLRIGEILGLTIDQVYSGGFAKDEIVLKRLKKRGRVVYGTIPVHPKLRVLLEQYKKYVLGSVNPYIFPSGLTDEHITRLRAHQILHKAFIRAGVPGASTHSMRRSCLTALYRAKVGLRTIQQISGHSNLGQLQAYLQVDPEDVVQAISILAY